MHGAASHDSRIGNAIGMVTRVGGIGRQLLSTYERGSGNPFDQNFRSVLFFRQLFHDQFLAFGLEQTQDIARQFRGQIAHQNRTRSRLFGRQSEGQLVDAERLQILKWNSREPGCWQQRFCGCP